MRGVSDGVSILSAQAYSPYGEPLFTDLPTDFGFTGEMTDSANDLVYLRARVMNPRLGIFGSLDPLERIAQFPTLTVLNNYSYAWDNPVNLIDPTGMYPEGFLPEESDDTTAHTSYAQSRCVAVSENLSSNRSSRATYHLASRNYGDIDQASAIPPLRESVCEGLCIEIAAMFNPLKSAENLCKIEFEKVCRLLCKQDPIQHPKGTKLPASHRGLFERYEQYDVNIIGTQQARINHRDPYLEVQEEFTREYDKWFRNCGIEKANKAPVKAFIEVAGVWKKQPFGADVGKLKSTADLQPTCFQSGCYDNNNWVFPTIFGVGGAAAIGFGLSIGGGGGWRLVFQ